MEKKSFKKVKSIQVTKSGDLIVFHGYPRMKKSKVKTNKIVISYSDCKIVKGYDGKEVLSCKKRR